MMPTALHALACPPLLALVLAACATAAAPAFRCASVKDCSLAGDCDTATGQCACDPGFTGYNCSVLDLVDSLPATGALRRATSSSWGGSVVFDAGSGLYQMLVADMDAHCGLNSWQGNSMISRATSKQPEGPYTIVQTVMSYFAHNPTVHAAPNDTLVVYHIGSGHLSGLGSTHQHRVCKNGTTPPLEPVAPPAGGCLSAPATVSPNMAFAHRSNLSHWEVVSGVPGSSCNNPAPLLLKNGTALLVCKMQLDSEDWRQMVLYRADHWRGPYHLVTVTQVFGEDAFLFQSPRGTLFMVLHAMHPHKVPSLAWSADGLGWTANGFAGPPSPDPHRSFNSSIGLSSGETVALSRRERHQLLFDADGHPTHIFNGVIEPNTLDHSYTAVQAFRQRARASGP